MNKVIHKTTLTLLGVTFLSSLLLSSTHVFSDTEVIDEVRLTVPVACTMSGTGTTHTATLSPGTYSGASGNEYENGIGKTTLTAICNDDNGFSIYAIGFTGNEYGVTNLIGQNTSGTMATKAYESGDTTSNWSMKLTKVDNPVSGDPVTYNPENLTISTGYNTWHAVPDTYTKVAEYHASTGSSTTDTTLGVKLETTYAAYIASNQAADTYEGQVKYTMVHPYDATAPVAPESPSASCAIPVSSKVAGIAYMQDVNSSNIATILSSLEEDKLYFLRDKRDEQPYCVAKLRDSKLWMTENLNIAGGTELSSEDTDFDANYTLPTTNGWTVTDGKLILPASAIKNDADNNLTDSAQFSTDNYAYVFNSGNKTNCGSLNQDVPCYSYYSWDAATLGSGRTLETENVDANYSICPKNWRLPTSGSTTNNAWKRGDYYALATGYGASLENRYYDVSTTTGANFYNNAGPDTAPDFLFAGLYYAGSFSHGGGSGYYWSATSSYKSTVSRSFFFSTSSVLSADSYDRKRGLSVRCLFENN